MTTSARNIVGNGRILSSAYEWKIDNYSSYSNLETGNCICSPSLDSQGTLWHLKLYPNGDIEEHQGYVSLYLYVTIGTQDIHNVQAQFALTCLDSRKKVIVTVNSNQMLTFSNTKALGQARFVNNTSINRLKEITIMYEVTIKDAKLYKSVLFISPDRGPDIMKHFEEFKNFRNNSKFSDVKLTVEKKEIFAHKVVLTANSSVFAAMFEHEMRENEENSVTIEDISYKVFIKLLDFMYTGECALSEDIVSELFEAADKYEILKLKSMCEEELCKNINVNNVVAYLKLADMHCAQQLKKEAINFIVLQGNKIVDEPEFKSIGNLNTELLLDVFRGVFASKS